MVTGGWMLRVKMANSGTKLWKSVREDQLRGTRGGVSSDAYETWPSMAILLRPRGCAKWHVQRRHQVWRATPRVLQTQGHAGEGRPSVENTVEKLEGKELCIQKLFRNLRKFAFGNICIIRCSVFTIKGGICKHAYASCLQVGLQVTEAMLHCSALLEVWWCKLLYDAAPTTPSSMWYAASKSLRLASTRTATQARS